MGAKPPGRGKRHDETLLIQKEVAINDYVSQIKSKRNGEPYILYGHSMGATLGYYITEKMEEIKDPPVTFIATGNSGPGIKYKETEGTQKKYQLDDDKDY
ncbi:MAG: thioesterase domain-containing protein [Tenacibaculum sp.]